MPNTYIERSRQSITFCWSCWDSIFWTSSGVVFSPRRRNRLSPDMIQSSQWPEIIIKKWVPFPCISFSLVPNFPFASFLVLIPVWTWLVLNFPPKSEDQNTVKSLIFVFRSRNFSLYSAKKSYTNANLCFERKNAPGWSGMGSWLGAFNLTQLQSNEKPKYCE